jgi:hypothetical protein
MSDGFRAELIRFEVFSEADFTGTNPQISRAISVRHHRVKTVLVHNAQGDAGAPPDAVTVDVLVKIRDQDDFVPLSTAIGGSAAAEEAFPFSFEDAFEEIKIRVLAGAVKPGRCSVTVLGGNGGG